MSRFVTRTFSPLLLLLYGLTVSFTLLGESQAQAQNEVAPSAASQAESSSDPNLVTYPENEEPNEVPGDNSIKPRPVSPTRKQALQRRAGEQVGNSPQGRAVVLGMHIQEANNERAKIVEVAPASPAFDAGIRKGDQIVSFDGFKATKYREWIDGMRRLATDVPDGDSIPIVLARDGKQLNLRLRVPVAKAGAALANRESTLNQTVVPNPGIPATTAIPGQAQPYLPSGGGYGGDTLIADALGQDFNSPAGDNAGRAVAEIVRINVPQQSAPAAGAPNPAAAGARSNAAARNGTIRAGADAAAGARVGIAGFRNDANGMFVMLDVGGLPPGNYLVGIDDPGLLGAGENVGANTGAMTPDAISNSRGARSRTGAQLPTPVAPAPGQPPDVPHANRANARQPVNPARGQTAPRGQSPAVVPPRPQPQRPIVSPPDVPHAQPSSGAGQPASPSGGGGGGGGGAPQGRLEAPSRNLIIPRTVLAQVVDPTADNTAPTNNVAVPEQTGVPATSQPGPVTPTAGTPVNTPATGAAPLGVAEAGPNVSGQAPILPSGGGPAMPIGTLTVDQSGAGRLQQVLESVHVQDVVGQAIVIYAQNANPQAILPPIANANTATAATNNAGRAQVSNSARRATPPTAAAGATTNRPNNSPAASANVAANGIGANLPVAGGVIRPLTEGEPTATGTTTAADTAQQGVQSTQSPTNTGNVPQSAVPNTQRPRVR